MTTSASSELCRQTFNKDEEKRAPSYISDFLTHYQPTRALMFSDAGILTVPKVAHKTSGETAFSSYAPRLLPAQLH